VPIPVALPPESATLQPMRVYLMKNVKAFTMIELLVVLGLLSAVIVMMVGILGNGSTNRQAESSAMKLISDFSTIEMAFTNYKQEKSILPTGLTDPAFVPTYLFPPKADTGFDKPAAPGWVDGYLLAASSDGNYICAQAQFSTPVGDMITSLKQRLSSQKIMVNTTCPSIIDAPPVAGTVSITYWLVRN
jgi:type II secretory pathway pseudopilin PulG